MDPSNVSSLSPKEQIEQALRGYSDFGQIQNKVREVRDKVLKNEGVPDPFSGKKTKQNFINIANKLKQSMQYPPKYNPSSRSVLQEFGGELTRVFEALAQKLIQNIYVPP